LLTGSCAGLLALGGSGPFTGSCAGLLVLSGCCPLLAGSCDGVPALGGFGVFGPLRELGDTLGIGPETKGAPKPDGSVLTGFHASPDLAERGLSEAGG
jgi:hypothetical protein